MPTTARDRLDGSTSMAAAINDLQALENLTGTGLAARVGTNDWALREIQPGAGVLVTNGDGVSADPAIAVDPDLVRFKIEANRTYYVRTNGSDSNTGLADTAAGAFATIQQALDVVAGLDLGDGSLFVTIKVADGTYSSLPTILPTIVNGDRVQIIGNVATPANCVLVFDTTAGAHGIALYRGFRLFKIDGFTIRGSGWSSHGVWTSGHIGTGVLVYGGGSLIVGANIRVSKFYYGIVAHNGSSIDIESGCQVDEAGDAAYLAFNGGHIVGSGLTATNSADTANALGSGFLAEQGGTLQCQGSTATGNAIAGFAARGGEMWAQTCVGSSNTLYGFWAHQKGKIEASGATASTNGIGLYAGFGSHILAQGATASGNTFDGCLAEDSGSQIEAGTGATSSSNGGWGFKGTRGGQITGTLAGTGNSIGLRYENTPTVLLKGVDETRTGTTTLADDSELVFAMRANGKYAIRGRIYFDTTAAADFKWRHVGPASPTVVRIHRRAVAPAASADSGISVDTAFSASDITVLSGSTDGGWIDFDGIIHNGVNAGNFSIQWAQNTSDGGNTIVRAGSSLEYRTMA